jgi:hypothetical protein
MNLTTRFIGRFLFAPVKGRSSARGGQPVQVIGPRMDWNADLGIDRHHLTLSVSQPFVRPGTSKPHLTTFSLEQDPGEIFETFIWDLAGCEVVCEGLKTTKSPLSFNFDKTPLFSDVAGGTPELNPNVDQDPERSGVSMLLQLDRGDLHPISPANELTFVYVPITALGPTGREQGHPIVEGMEHTCTAEDQVAFRITRFRDGRKWSVVLGATSDQDPIVMFSHTCGRTVADPMDREFSAYYELLKKPVDPGDRRVPFQVAPKFAASHMVHGPNGTADCNLQAALA